MKCPACNKQLQTKKLEGMEVEICKGGCGGLWLDRTEYKKVDNQTESIGQELLNIERDENITINHGKRLCPKCNNIVLMRRFSSVKREIEIDKCPYCGGYWLDGGELGRIRHLFDNEKDKGSATTKYLNNFQAKALAKNDDKQNQMNADSNTISRLFRLLSPY